MKTEAVIRRHRDNLRKAIVAPCGCATTEHIAKCFIGSKMMRAVEEKTLSWLLGENESHGKMVEEMDADLNRL